MPRESEFERLTQEWRADVKKRLDDQANEIDSFRNGLTSLILTSSTNVALGELEKRVRELEKFQMKAIATVAAAQVFVAVVWAVIIFLVKK